MSPNIPGGWLITQLESFTDIVLGQSPPSSTYNTEKDGLPFFQGKTEFGNLYPTPQKWCDSPKKIANQGDVLISVRAPVGSTNICVEKSCIGRGLAAIRGLAGIDTLFLIHLIRTFEDSIAQKGTGTTFKAISGNILRNLELPLPPLNEQKRIVTKIEALQTRNTAVKEELEAIKPLLNQFRQSVLASAFRGDLTKDWREQNPDVEPAEVLLERIKVERRRRWEEAELEKMKTKGKIPKDDKWKKKYKEPELIETESLPELPDGWCWIMPNQIAALISNALTIGPFGSNLKVSDYCKQGVPLVFVKEIRSEFFGHKDTRYISHKKANELKSHRILPGELLITKMGDPPGDTTIYPEKMPPGIITADCIKWTPNTKITSSIFLKYWLRANYAKKAMLDETKGVAQQKLSLKRFRTIRLPIPPLKEQKEIVRRIESLFKLADNIEQQYQQAEVDLETLNQSILAKAFRGELVPQDPNDEPASVLLERIKEERDKAKATAKKSKTKKRSSKKNSSKKKDEQLGIPGM